MLKVTRLILHTENELAVNWIIINLLSKTNIMKTAIQKKIAQYKFEDSLKIVYATPIGNALLFIAFLMADTQHIFTNPYALFSLGGGAIFFLIIQVNNWEYHSINLMLIYSYLFSTLLEFLLFGIPPSLLGYGSGFSVSKGVLLEIIGGLMPLIYVGARFLLVVPLIQMTKASYQLKNLG